MYQQHGSIIYYVDVMLTSWSSPLAPVPQAYSYVIGDSEGLASSPLPLTSRDVF